MFTTYYYVYMMASQSGSVLYVGVTNDLVRRGAEHRMGLADSFTKKYRVMRLVYFEVADDPLAAIAREKQLKGWSRWKKVRLIQSQNPGWRDLYDDL